MILLSTMLLVNPLFLFSHAVHAPSVSITRSSNSSIRAGEVVKLVCLAVVNTNYVNTPVRGVIKWYHHTNQTTQPMMIQPTHRISISTNQLQSVITFTPVLMEDEGTIRCVVSLMPFGERVDNILPSEGGAGLYNLMVEGEVHYNTYSNVFILLLHV